MIIQVPQVCNSGCLGFGTSASSIAALSKRNQNVVVGSLTCCDTIAHKTKALSLHTIVSPWDIAVSLWQNVFCNAK